MQPRGEERNRSIKERRDQAYLHDELNGADKVTEELQNQIFLLLFHLIQTVLLSPRGYIALRQAMPGICVEHLFRHRTGATGFDLFLFFLDGAISRLELIDQSIDVLVLLIVVVISLLLHRSRNGSVVVGLMMTGLFRIVSGAIELSTGNIGAQMVRWCLVRTGNRRVLSTGDDLVGGGGHVGHCRSWYGSREGSIEPGRDIQEFMGISVEGSKNLKRHSGSSKNGVFSRKPGVLCEKRKLLL